MIRMLERYEQGWLTDGGWVVSAGYDPTTETTLNKIIEQFGIYQKPTGFALGPTIYTQQKEAAYDYLKDKISTSFGKPEVSLVLQSAERLKRIRLAELPPTCTAAEKEELKVLSQALQATSTSIQEQIATGMQLLRDSFVKAEAEWKQLSAASKAISAVANRGYYNWDFKDGLAMLEKARDDAVELLKRIRLAKAAASPVKAAQFITDGSAPRTAGSHAHHSYYSYYYYGMPKQNVVRLSAQRR
jgi:hypothetical protein